MNKSKWNNLMLLCGVIVLAVVPILFVAQKGDEEIFAGADAEAEALITRIRPDYKPWFNSLWTPPSGEIESMLFALQAAIGAGLLGYYFGLRRGQAMKQQASEANASH